MQGFTARLLAGLFAASLSAGDACSGALAVAGGLDADDPLQRIAAIEQLSAAPSGPLVERLLATVSGDPDMQVRMTAAAALGGSSDSRVAPVLVELLRRDREQRTGLWAALIPALGSLGSDLAVPVLMDSLNDRDEFWLGREMAARALGRIGDARAVPALVKAAWAYDTRAAAIQALAAIGDVRAAEVLVSALTEEDPETRAAARRALANLGDAVRRQMLDAFVSLPAGIDDLQRRALCELLVEVPNAEVLAALRSATCDGDAAIRACSRSLLGDIACPD